MSLFYGSVGRPATGGRRGILALWNLRLRERVSCRRRRLHSPRISQFARLFTEWQTICLSGDT